MLTRQPFLTILASAQLMELHLVVFHPEEKKVKEEEGDFTLEEKVEGGQEGEGGKVGEGAGDICQLCDQPLPPPLSLADHLLAEHDVSISLSLFPSFGMKLTMVWCFLGEAG